MGKLAKSSLGILTVLPLIYIFGILFVFSDFKYDTIQKLHYGMMAVYALLLIIYIRDVRTNERLPDDKRALWGALIFFGSSPAQLVYFWLYVWPEDAPAAVVRPG
ncbi:MAG TPA: hypothetical protein VNA69_19305 [Thermoanaerobaculia bacterium]|nr:hypothetical protein [Thermoanaerobaculia bacterium]